MESWLNYIWLRKVEDHQRSLHFFHVKQFKPKQTKTNFNSYNNSCSLDFNRTCVSGVLLYSAGVMTHNAHLCDTNCLRPHVKLFQLIQKIFFKGLKSKKLVKF